MYLCKTELFAHLQADVGYAEVRAKVCNYFMENLSIPKNMNKKELVEKIKRQFEILIPQYAMC